MCIVELFSFFAILLNDKNTDKNNFNNWTFFFAFQMSCTEFIFP